MRAKRPFRLTVVAVLVLAFSVMLTAAAGAHRNDESYVYLDVGDNDLRGSVQLPYPDMRTVFGFDLFGTEAEVRAEIEDNLAFLQDYVAERTEIGVDGVPWTLTFDDYELLEEGNVEGEGLGYVILPFVIDLQGQEVPQRIDVGFTAFLDEIPDRNNIALISNDWKRGVIGSEANELVVFDSGTRSGVIDLGNSSQWKNFDASIDLGVDHIRTGPDHIFFIFVLLLPSVLILKGRNEWEPATSFRRSLLRVLIVATMFTLAHSITFTLAGLDFLPLPPSKFTETLIAVSIVVAALNNLWPVLGHREWLIAFVFGLFHGLGFAGFVEDLEIDRTTQLVSLLGRNVGIEIGQAVIVLITFPALFLLSRTKLYRSFFLGASLLLAGISTVWVFERLFEFDAGINDTVDKLLEWPRALWLCLIATVLVGAYAWFETQRSTPSVTESPDRDLVDH